MAEKLSGVSCSLEKIFHRYVSSDITDCAELFLNVNVGEMTIGCRVASCFISGTAVCPRLIFTTHLWKWCDFSEGSSGWKEVSPKSSDFPQSTVGWITVILSSGARHQQRAWYSPRCLKVTQRSFSATRTHWIFLMFMRPPSGEHLRAMECVADLRWERHWSPKRTLLATYSLEEIHWTSQGSYVWKK